MLEVDLESQQSNGKFPGSFPAGIPPSQSIRRLRWALRKLHLIKSEEPIGAGMVRLRWQSAYGRHFYFDVNKESDLIDADASHELLDIRKTACPGSSISNRSYQHHSSSSTQTASVQTASREDSRTSESRQIVPRKPVPVRAHRELAARPHGAPRFENGWVILCIPKGASVRIYHERLSERIPDEDLFDILKKEYEKRRPRWQRILVLREVAKIELTHFRLHNANHAISRPWEWPPEEAQRHVERSCVMPADPKPPLPEVYPEWLKSLWDGDSMQTVPEELPQSIRSRMRPYFYSLFQPDPAPGPQVTIARDFWTFDRIPKRVGSMLTLCDHHPEYLKGWGVEIVEDFHILGRFL